MKKNVFMTVAVATLFLITFGVNAGFAKQNGDGKKGESQTEKTMDHSHITSGAEYGDHVSDMAQKTDKHGIDRKGFSGEMNPGTHHQGYSGIKNANK
jgi:hypothetical protein